VQGAGPFLIGHKSPGSTTNIGIAALKAKLGLLANITKLPLNLIYLLRNPFDRIATVCIKDLCDPNNLNYQACEQGIFDDVEHKDAAPKDVSSVIQHRIKSTFDNHKTVQDLAELLNADPNLFGVRTKIIPIVYEDLVSNATATMRQMCEQLGIECNEDYISATSSTIWKRNHYTRLDVMWGQENICKVAKQTDAMPLLSFYTRRKQMIVPLQLPKCWGQCFPGASPCACGGNLESICH